MKQILQHLNDGTIELLESPTPSCSEGHLIISTNTTLISAGTERMLVDFGKASYLAKAKQQPEKVRMVLEKIKTDGLMTTVQAVRSKLSQPISLGYCHVGTVVEVGKNVRGFRVGDRVISNGPHAEMVKAPSNLCARIPENVNDETAVFTVLASIALQGIRLANPSLGECFTVIGVGLIGLLTVQLLKANGCRVLAIDFDDTKLNLAKQFGAEICNLSQDEDPVAAGLAFSRCQGVDGVIITTSTRSQEPIKQAARMSRKRGRIVLVGTTGLELDRADFYEKELSFQVSCSYGPGRYDPSYEEKGFDYPIGFVRWTEKRNFEAVLDMMSVGQLNVKPLITHTFLFEKATEAYQILTQDKSALGIVLQYNNDISKLLQTTIKLDETREFDSKKPLLGVIGAGNYASRILLPAFKKIGAQFHTLVTTGGISGSIHGKKLGFATTSTDQNILFSNDAINTITIVTRHDTHANLVSKALSAGKHVFVEKPLALSLQEVSEVEAAYHTAKICGKKNHLMVGFNRRFAPQVQKIKKLLQTISEPKSFIMTMNAGAIPAEHWIQDNATGGGRIIGEACHFIDLMRFLAGSKIISIQARRMGDNAALKITEDKAAIILGFADGSFGTINYLANGAAAFPKERIEIFTAGRVLQLDNFRKLKGYGWPEFKTMNLWKQNKGQEQCVQAFLSAIEQGLATPIPVEEIFEVARVSIEVAEQLRRQ
ncbi:bi-domain-containing oxidoreductase [Legionella jamestowniensis]|uniref:Myo-inositol-2-dehydrogenase n=1 Tax=Legionella jamestowniensis TaxID=455 RepID=A0A0W0UG15_9GAMM|nr:bi-domain-containing oxidoreductase [Legionella jamestowniensis]KTD06817.1 myo-inositol-2-dehydrogenase [Legionella jamestowniensis]SFL82748.1 Predicted dehydrogenase [Legionella jamestowniensis DSM 19215]